MAVFEKSLAALVFSLPAVVLLVFMNVLLLC